MAGACLRGRNDRNFPPPNGQAPIAEGTCDLQTNEDDGRPDLQDVARVDSAWQTVPPATGRPTVRELLFASGVRCRPQSQIWEAVASCTFAICKIYYEVDHCQRDPVVVYWPSGFLEAWGLVAWQCRCRRQCQKSNIVLKRCCVLALVPQASNKPLGQNTITGSL